jgi:hypothetical protein
MGMAPDFFLMRSFFESAFASAIPTVIVLPFVCAGISDFSADGDLSEPTTASGLPFKRLLTVHRAALGWLPLTQQRDLGKAPALTLSSSSIAVCALRAVLCSRPSLLAGAL